MSVWLHLKESKTSVTVLPKQCGTSSLHIPKELHSVLAVPFSTNPSSQVAVHWEPKVKEPFGSAQDREPWGSSISSHFFTWKSKETTRSQIIFKIHMHPILHAWRCGSKDNNILMLFRPIYTLAVSTQYSYLGKQEVHDSSDPVMNILSHLCQSDQNPPHTEKRILIQSWTLQEGASIAWRYWAEPLESHTLPLEKKRASEECTYLCVLRMFMLFWGNWWLQFFAPPVHVGVALLHCPEAMQVSVESPVRL